MNIEVVLFVVLMKEFIDDVLGRFDVVVVGVFSWRYYCSFIWFKIESDLVINFVGGFFGDGDSIFEEVVYVGEGYIVWFICSGLVG